MLELKAFLSDKDGTRSSSRLFGFMATLTMCFSLCGLTYAAIISEKDVSVALGVVVGGLSGLAGFNYYNNSKRKENESESSDEDK